MYCVLNMGSPLSEVLLYYYTIVATSKLILEYFATLLALNCIQLNGQSDKEIADEYFVKNSEVRQAQVLG